MNTGIDSKEYYRSIEGKDYGQKVSDYLKEEMAKSIDWLWQTYVKTYKRFDTRYNEVFDGVCQQLSLMYGTTSLYVKEVLQNEWKRRFEYRKNVKAANRDIDWLYKNYIRPNAPRQVDDTFNKVLERTCNLLASLNGTTVEEEKEVIRQEYRQRKQRAQ